ncbi:T9SS sorting signal type C domain-containing protein [Flavobacterium poyangense]|uniref:T9SS sorting signal type C domain-containing protein n=1 Tax=Flavobacterium poyangense TaxID=2204302 RepID=UPI00141EAC83|nr:T9SS sorting signal type C domain-containing protein [Flavobacterium sp. JXAS1]
MVQSGSCATLNSTATTVTVSPTTVAGSVGGGTTVCIGTNSTLLTLSGHTGSIVRWESSLDNFATAGTPIVNTSATFTATNLTATTSYRAVVKSGSCLQLNSVATTVTVSPTTVAGSIDGGATVCTGTNSTTLTLSGHTGSVVRWESSLDNFATAGTTIANTTTTLTATNITATTSYRAVVKSGACGELNSASATITVNILPDAPIVGTITHPTCVITTGSVVLSGLPGTGTWTLTRTPGNVTTTGTGTEVTISGLAANTTYTYTVSNGTCPSVASNNIPVNAIPQLATWNGGWTNGPPTINQPVHFATSYTSGGDINSCSCTIASTANIVISSGNTLTITNGLTVANGGTLTFENNSSLVQKNNNATNSGIIRYKRKTALRVYDYGYWSTPVSPKKLVDVSPLTLSDKYMGFNGNGWVITNPNTVMTVGKGYIIRGPQNHSKTVREEFTAIFEGTPNNGVINAETVEASKFYLVGNPYPSALDVNEFLKENTFMNGTLYFWTHNTPISPTTNKYVADDYASFNLTGGVLTGPAPSGDDAPGNNNEEPKGYVAAGQSFFISAETPGTINFNNDMRIGGDKNGQFFKPAKPSKEKTTRNRIWLNMTNQETIFKQILLGYVDGATNGFDKNYDGESFDGNPNLDFYSIATDRNLVIQGRALPFTDADIIPLGYRSAVAGGFSIEIGKIDGDLINKNVYLEDKTTGKIHNLKTGKYTFTTAKGTFADRFVLRYTDKTLGTGDFENTENNVLVTVKNKVLKVVSAKETIKEVTIYDVSGKQLYNKKKVGETELQIANLQSANQVLLIKITLDNNHTTTKKVIFQ